MEGLCLKLHIDMPGHFQYASIGRSIEILWKRHSGVLQSESAAFIPNDGRSNNGPSIALANADFPALFEFAARNGEISVFNLLASHAPLCYG